MIYVKRVEISNYIRSFCIFFQGQFIDLFYFELINKGIE